MAKYKIASLPGDGIGKEVMEAARIVLDNIGLDAEYIHGDVGWEFWRREGNPLPDRTKEVLRKTDCCLFGAITSKPKEEAAKELTPDLQGKGFTYSSPIVSLRQEFNLYTNLRPAKAYKGNPGNYRDDIDLVVFRQNTEGLYAGIEFFPLPDELRECLSKHNEKFKKFDPVLGDDIAISCRVITREACRLIARQAFEYARKMGRKRVTVVEKPNILRETSGMMLSECRNVAKGYSEIELGEANIDAMCMWLVKNPQDYDVIVTTNLFGDIMSDLCAQLVGGLGFGCSGNIGDNYAVFEPLHGSAPKYAGLYKVNPIAMILSAKMMLDYLGERELATRLDNAVARVIGEGKVRTYDMGGTSRTLDVASEIVKKFSLLREYLNALGGESSTMP